MSNEAFRQLFWKDTEAKLPIDALPCEYIESTMENQCINTGIYVAQKLQIVLRGQFASYAGKESWLFGCWNNGHGQPYDARSYLIGFYEQSLRAEVGPDIQQYWSNVQRDTNIHDFALLKSGSWIDNAQRADSDFNYMPTRTTSQMMLFKSPHVNEACTKRIYAFQALDQKNNLVMDLLPAFNTTQSKAGFWDIVTKKWLFGMNGNELGYKLA